MSILYLKYTGPISLISVPVKITTVRKPITKNKTELIHQRRPQQRMKLRSYNLCTISAKIIPNEHIRIRRQQTSKRNVLRWRQTKEVSKASVKSDGNYIQFNLLKFNFAKPMENRSLNFSPPQHGKQLRKNNRQRRLILHYNNVSHSPL